MGDGGKYFTGTGRYTNLVLETTVNTPDRFAVIPRGIPYLSILYADVIFLGLGSAVYFSDGFFTPPIPSAYKHLLFGGMSLIAVVYTLANYLSFRNESQKGPWLIWHHKEKTLELPRLGRSLASPEVELLVASGEINAGEGNSTALRTVYELHALIHGEDQSLMLLSSYYPFEKVIQGVKRHTPLKVRDE